MSTRAHAAILIVLAFAVYATGIQAPFHLDDHLWIVDDPGIRDLWPFDGYRNRPFLMFTLSLNYAISGPDPVAFRLTNIAIHACAALLLYGIVRRTLMLPRFGSIAPTTVNGIAFAVASLWVVHPLNTEAVTYLWQRCESQMGMFFLAAIYSTLRHAEGQKRALWMSLTILSCLLGFATKETMVAIIPTLLVYDWVMINGTLRGALRARWPVYGMFAAIIVAGVTVVLPNTSTSIGNMTWWEFVRSQPGIVLDYIRLTLLPYPQCFDYGLKPTESLLLIAGATLVIGALLAYTVRELLKKSWQGLAAAWFFLTLAPTSSFIPTNDLMWEYRMYLPSIGLIALAVGGGRVLCARWKVAPGHVLLGALLAYGALAALRNWDYRSEVALWQASAAQQPENARAHVSLVRPLIEAGEPYKALEHARRGFELNPDFLARWKLARALTATGDLEAAIEQCELCAKQRKRDVKVRRQIGRLHMRLKHPKRAAAAYRKAVKFAPDDPGLRSEFARVCAEIGLLAEAENNFKEALRLNPKQAASIGVLALNASRNKRSAGQRALGLRVALLTVDITGRKEAGPLVTLARVYEALGRPKLARAAYDEALRLPQVIGDPPKRAHIERMRDGKAGRLPVGN